MAKISGPEIVRQIALGSIEIDPFDVRQLNPNSYNVRLGMHVKILQGNKYGILDVHEKPTYEELTLYRSGLLVRRGKVYLCHTVERVHANGYVPHVDGRSTTGRFGVKVHETAGFGDDGFNGTFTLEISATHLDTLIYPGDLIAQISFDTLIGQRMPYAGVYNGQVGPREPKALEFWDGLDEYLRSE